MDLVGGEGGFFRAPCGVSAMFCGSMRHPTDTKR
ncbi:UDP-N-acetylglucosamine transferase [Zymobacter palmae]|uniref:UDP-N-acetylglucosamine transferase n=1 Tax=Zymobacter palmae TaxID=33074 RepID=A0A348HHT5_9GAMM|nr:UDP-N-acetylglucosamine transferase [Zymobacter palmae]